VSREHGARRHRRRDRPDRRPARRADRGRGARRVSRGALAARIAAPRDAERHPVTARRLDHARVVRPLDRDDRRERDRLSGRRAHPHPQSGGPGRPRRPPGRPPVSARKPTAVIITTGGTIASRPDPVTGAVVPAVSGEDLVSAVPGLSHVANVEVRAYRNVLGPALEPEDLFAIGRMAVDALKQDAVDGVVVTSGTGIIEEGSYLCDLLNTTDKPLVWTGAQFSADMWDTDGPRNLLNSVRVA